MVLHGYHVPVLCHEVISYLMQNPDGIYIDATIGGGGHSEQIIQRLSDKGRLIGIDRDPESIAFCSRRLKEFELQVRLIQAPFNTIDQVVQQAGIERLDGVFLDLGVSSHQIDDPSRGFSYLQDGLLDMRMDMQSAITAYDIIQTYSETSLADLFFYFGEEKRSRQIARRIVEYRRNRPIRTTMELAALIREMMSGPMINKTLSRIFQALRIEVNDEIGQLKAVLQKGGSLLKKGGRMVVISYHSLEDRLVKRFFRGEVLSIERKDIVEKEGDRQFKLLNKKVIQPDIREIQINPRARSARLRAAEKF